MELMPHIQTLVDDLIKMTDHIVVKRSDLAEMYDTNSKTKLLYQQCAEIIDGMPNFYSFKVYPKEVLNQYSKWVETSDPSLFGALKPLSSGDNIILKMGNNADMTISHDDPFKYFEGKIIDYNRQNIGNGWVQYLDNGFFRKIHNSTVYTAESTSNIYESDQNGNPDYSKQVENFKFFGSGIENIKTVTFYVKDNFINKFIPVTINFISEFVPVIFNNTEDNIGDWIYYIKPNGERYTFTDNPELLSQKIIIDNTEDVGSIYWLRYKILLKITDNKYFLENEFINSNQEVNDRLYEKIDDMLYYINSMTGIYEPYYIQDNSGDYYFIHSEKRFEPLPEYDPDNEEIVEFYNNLNYDDVYRKATSESVQTFYNYSYINKDEIVQSTKILDGIDVYRYETYGDEISKIKIYYSYDAENIIFDNLKLCSPIFQFNNKQISYIAEERIEYNDDNNPEIKSYYKSEPYSIYYFLIDPYGEYYYENDETSQYYGCIRKIDSSTDISSKIRYTISEIETSGSEAFIFEVGECKYWLSEKVFTDNQIISCYNNRENIPYAYRDDLSKMMEKYIIKLYCPDYFDKSKYAVPLYTGETNNYYREINGLPTLNSSLTNPRFDRLKVNPTYTGTYTNPFIYELSDAEIESMEELGYLDKYKEAYPDLKYLYHLGKNRVDVIKARQAAPYDILSINDAELPITKTAFLENYALAKNYVIKKQYKPELFQTHEYYHAYIGFLICVLAMIMCVTKSGELLIKNIYMDQKTVDLILKSYGFEHTFESIPLIYRREIARNIIKLIRNKGIDAIYETIYELFGMEDIEVYKYYFKKVYQTNPQGELTPQLSISQVPINSENMIKELNDASNILNYDDITSSDRYWGVYQSKESIKNKLLESNFNFLNTKYITLNNKFNLTELNFNSAYLLNYLLEATKRNNNSIKIEVDEIEDNQELVDLLIALFAIQSIKYGFDGNIPNDIVSTASVYKFNLDETVTGENGKPKQIIDYYIDYMSQDAARSVRGNNLDSPSVESIINSVISSNELNAGQKVPIYNYKSDKSINSLAERYLLNLNEDNSFTIKNENALYNRLIELRENADTYIDFKCFDELLKCISVCEENDSIYKLTIPKWELMYENEYEDKFGELVSVLPNPDGNIYYSDIRKSWNILINTQKLNFINSLDQYKITLRKVINIDEIGKEYIDITKIYTEDGIDYYKETEDSDPIRIKYADDKMYYDHFTNLPNNIVLSNKVPGVDDFDSSINYVIKVDDISRSELISSSLSSIGSSINIYNRIDLMNKNEHVLGIWDKLIRLKDAEDKEHMSEMISSLNIGSGNIIYSGYKTLDNFISENLPVSDQQLFYAEIRPILNLSKPHYTIKIYRKCTTALTYAMYLQNEAPDIYEYIQQRNESKEDYLERLSKFNSTIIATIESNIGSKDIRDKLKMSYVDFSNISKYIRLLINVFKSYTVDLSSLDIIYNIDDKDNNRIKMIDDYYTDEQYSLVSNLHLSDKISSEEKYFVNDNLKIKDEIFIEYYARQYFDVNTLDTETYIRVCDNVTSDYLYDKRISLYWYSKSLSDNYYSTDYMIKNVIGNI